MKTLLSIAAALAAITTVSAASAHDRSAGHWEWQSQPAFGPNKSNLPSQVRVWVNDRGSEMAACNCAMMKMSAADCMVDMRGRDKVPSAG